MHRAILLQNLGGLVGDVGSTRFSDCSRPLTLPESVPDDWVIMHAESSDRLVRVATIAG